MIGKILFTLAVILLVALIWRTRSPRRPAPQAHPRLVNPPAKRLSPVRVLAVATVALMLFASAYLLYEHWRDSSDVIFIRVIDAGSGRTVEYRAQRGDIQEREFLTTDGRRIVLAETERLETSTIRSPSSVDQN
jgi:small-conductance mechanosensitive channel